MDDKIKELLTTEMKEHVTDYLYFRLLCHRMTETLTDNEIVQLFVSLSKK